MNSLKSATRIHLTDAAKIRRRLGNHFRHKIPVRMDEEVSHLDFGIGECEMRNRGLWLCVDCAANTEQDLYEIQETLERHLLGVAPMTSHPIEWQRES